MSKMETRAAINLYFNTEMYNVANKQTTQKVTFRNAMQLCSNQATVQQLMLSSLYSQCHTISWLLSTAAGFSTPVSCNPFLTVLQLLFLKFLARTMAGLTSSGVAMPYVAFFLSIDSEP